MSNQNMPVKRWNLFARELEDILTARGFRLGQLDDRAGIHREKVRRLSQSLLRPKSFPVLNADEMASVATEFGLSEQEILRLRAAVLASSIEKTLMDRIDQENALLGAEQLFPLIVRAVEELISAPGGLGSLKAGGMDLVQESDVDLALELALETIDKATIDLQLSYHVKSHAERIGRVRQARDGFNVALAELEEADEDIQATEAWREWYDEARRGLSAAAERLEALGG